MKQRPGNKSGGWGYAAALCLAGLELIAMLLGPLAAHAQSGIAIGGTFYAQDFEIPLGASIGAASIYVTVFNEGQQSGSFAVSYQAPAGVVLTFSEDQFSLDAGQQRQILVTVEVGEEAVPGDYQLVVTAQQVVPEVEGQLAMVAVASQQAGLTIVGDSSQVVVRALSPDGDAVSSQLRLFRVTQGSEREFGASKTGLLEAKVSPGSYLAAAYVDGQKLAEQHFDIAAGENVAVDLTVRTVYFGGVGAVANHYADTGKLAHAQIVYTIINLYQDMANVEIVLSVKLDGQLLEERSLITLASLSTGRTGGNYSYVPSQGWQSGQYSFELALYADDHDYTRAMTDNLVVEMPSAMNLTQIGGLSLAVVAAAGAGYYFVKKNKA